MTFLLNMSYDTYSSNTFYNAFEYEIPNPNHFLYAKSYSLYEPLRNRTYFEINTDVGYSIRIDYLRHTAGDGIFAKYTDHNGVEVETPLINPVNFLYDQTINDSFSYFGLTQYPNYYISMPIIDETNTEEGTDYIKLYWNNNDANDNTSDVRYDIIVNWGFMTVINQVSPYMFSGLEPNTYHFNVKKLVLSGPRMYTHAISKFGIFHTI